MNMDDLNKKLDGLLSSMTQEDIAEWRQKNEHAEIEAQARELASHVTQDDLERLDLFNHGLHSGYELGKKYAWHKTMIHDEKGMLTYYDAPPLYTPVIGLYRQTRKGSNPWRAEYVWAVPNPDGDGGWDWGRIGRDGMGAPDYWMPMPDPMAYPD